MDLTKTKAFADIELNVAQNDDFYLWLKEEYLVGKGEKPQTESLILGWFGGVLGDPSIISHGQKPLEDTQ